MTVVSEWQTERLAPTIPQPDDLDRLYQIHSDPRVWTHFPSLRHQSTDQTQVMLDAWIAAWRRDGLGTWTVRLRDEEPIIGIGGCSLRSNSFWNLGYRFDPDLQGRGYATELSIRAMAAAQEVRPEVPIVAYLLEHNHASARVAEKVGLQLVHRAPDAGNPDPAAIRLVYADRPLDAEVLHAALA